jgi:phage baseplate assembly protein W
LSIQKQIAAFRLAQTRVGDTLPVIAARELGSAASWPDLATLNGLLPPWITDDFASASPTVLWAGQQTIKIPASAPPPSGVSDPNTVFGTDVALPNGRFVFTATGDLATISGTANLAQALRNRLMTPLGELIRHLLYGCDVFKLLGTGSTATTNLLAATLVARAVRRDQRVARVENATGTIQGDTITVTATAVSVDGKRVPTGLTAQ